MENLFIVVLICGLGLFFYRLFRAIVSDPVKKLEKRYLDLMIKVREAESNLLALEPYYQIRKELTSLRCMMERISNLSGNSIEERKRRLSAIQAILISTNKIIAEPLRWLELKYYDPISWKPLRRPIEFVRQDGDNSISFLINPASLKELQNCIPPITLPPGKEKSCLVRVDSAVMPFTVDDFYPVPGGLLQQRFARE